MIFGRNLNMLTPNVLKARHEDWRQRQQAATSMQTSAAEVMRNWMSFWRRRRPRGSRR
jgi:hypothetical protein